MLGTCRPARIHESVVEKLLNVVNNPLFEVLCVISEHSDASNRLLHGRFVSTPNGLNEIVPKQAHQTVCVHLGNWPFLFPTSSDYIARRAVCYAITNLNVALAKDLMTHDAQAAPPIERERIAAFRTSNGSVNLPHDWFPGLTCWISSAAVHFRADRRVIGGTCR